jgi:hypothetical protein
MKPSILAAFSEAIPYIPGLRQQTGSVVATILMMQLEYRFAKYPEGFYKFLEPPQNGHQDYKIGDSWVEELAFSKEEFRTGFDKIGVRYNSKTQYDEAKSSGSEFGSSYYCSYVDRRSGLTFYFRNHSKVDELISDIEPRQKSMGFRPRKTRPQMVDPDLREIGNPNLPDVVFSEVSKLGFPIYQSGESQFTDPYIDISEKTSEKTTEKIPPTPQGESEWGGIPNEAVLVSNEDLGQEGTEDLTPHQSPEQDPPVKNHLPTPEIKHPAAVEFDSRFLPTDTTADNMNTWNAIIKTGAMRGERSPDPEFLEYYRVLLSKCTHYRGKDCNSNHAKSSLAQKWKSEPLKILADAESWLKAKAKTTASTQVRSTKDLSLEEKIAVLQRVQDRKNSQAKGA